jgi:lipoprotein NlpD
LLAQGLVQLMAAMPVQWMSLIAVALCLGCSVQPKPSSSYQHSQTDPAAFPYVVQPGDTLWRIARAFGLNHQAIAELNALSPEAVLVVGQELSLPLPPEAEHFYWPVLGRVGPAPLGQGLWVQRAGAWVRSARSGVVVMADRDYRGWGGVVVLDHGDGKFTVYGQLAEVVARAGQRLAQGAVLGRIAQQPLYFEIREHQAALDAVALLPRLS